MSPPFVQFSNHRDCWDALVWSLLLEVFKKFFSFGSYLFALLRDLFESTYGLSPRQVRADTEARYYNAGYCYDHEPYDCQC